jgi:hypothetical protein
VGVADCGADILVAEQLLDFPQIVSHVVEQNCRRRMPSSYPVRSGNQAAEHNDLIGG